MNYKLIAIATTAALSLGGLAIYRYKREKEGWTVLEKVILGVGATAFVATVVILTKDYIDAKELIEATGELATDEAIVNAIDLKSMPTVGDIAKEYKLTPQKAAQLIKDLDISHAGEVIRTGFDNGWHYCKVYGPEAAEMIREALV